MHKKVEAHLLGAKYKLIIHTDFSVPITSPDDFSKLSGIPMERITKTLLIRTKTKPWEYVEVVCPIYKRLDLKKISQFIDTPHSGGMCIATPGELDEVLDYPTKGVSPLGIDKLKILVDESVCGCSTVCVGSGTSGEEIEISPQDLIRFTGACVCEICQ